MLSLNDIKIIFYGPDFATKALSPRLQKKKKKKILHFVFREFLLNLTVLLTKIMPKGLVQVAKFKVPLIRSILVHKDILPK